MANQMANHMTVIQVAKAIEMSTETVYRRLRSGDLEGHHNGNNGGYWVIPRTAVLKWLREEQRDAQQAARDEWQIRIDAVREA
jgi:excisionase family DNA binding protein